MLVANLETTLIAPFYPTRGNKIIFKKYNAIILLGRYRKNVICINRERDEKTYFGIILSKH
jgi:hypothetical protein